jgi:hypothetical protein
MPERIKILPNPPGDWIDVNESMSDFSRSYQKEITGVEGKAYRVNGVNFDGVEPGAYIDVKGRYGKFVSSKTGEFYETTKIGKQFENQALRQLQAAGGNPINWYFAEAKSANATKALFQREGITGINIIHRAPK